MPQSPLHSHHTLILNSISCDPFSVSVKTQKNSKMLHTEPSFSIYNKDDKFGDEAENENLIKEKIEKSAITRQSLDSQFSFGSNSMRIIEEDDDEDEDEEEQKQRTMSRFKDLSESGPSNFDHHGDLDIHYSKLVEENPSNPKVLRNYAQYLESKGDFSGAEEYCYRATLADPKDGEILSEYAKLVWDIHRDQAKASDYFERAVRAAPENSNVLASYASFIWRIDDESGEEEENRSNNTQADKFKEVQRPSSPPMHLAMGLGIDGYDINLINARLDESNNVEEYHRRMVEENPRNPSALRNYALFLHQSKGDLDGAEEYYSRAIVEDPDDGQMLSVYAGVLWQLYGDKDRAISYFERAVLATPEDSNVLAAYAKFLWETEEDDAQGV